MAKTASIDGNVILDAFNFLGGDSSSAERDGRGHTVDGWITWQASQAAAVGAIASAIPGAHLVTITGDVIVLLHKMAHCAWGVGGAMGVPVNGKSDLAIILALWSKAIPESKLVAYMEKAAEIAVIGGSAAAVTAAALSHPHMTAVVAGKAVDITINFILEDTPIHALGALGSPAGNLAQKYTEKALVKASSLAPAFMKKMAHKLAAVISTHIGRKALSGFLPVVGTIISGGVNAYIISNVGEAARTYYREKKRSLEKAVR